MKIIYYIAINYYFNLIKTIYYEQTKNYKH